DGGTYVRSGVGPGAGAGCERAIDLRRRARPAVRAGTVRTNRRLEPARQREVAAGPVAPHSPARAASRGDPAGVAVRLARRRGSARRTRRWRRSGGRDSRRSTRTWLVDRGRGRGPVDPAPRCARAQPLSDAFPSLLEALKPISSPAPAVAPSARGLPRRRCP